MSSTKKIKLIHLIRWSFQEKFKEDFVVFEMFML